MTEIAMGNLMAIFSTVMIIVSYVVTALTMYKISAKENISKPFFAWIPGFNDYLLIRLGQGSVWFMILALASLGLGGPLTNYLDNAVFAQAGAVVTALWAIYKIFLYNRICDRYDANIIILAAGYILQLVSKLSIVGLIIAVAGQVLLMKKVKSNIKPKTIIESKIVISKMEKKEKKSKK